MAEKTRDCAAKPDDTTDQDIAYCQIHPAIGIARVGNSPAEFFLGPEIPGQYIPPAGGYKDAGAPENGVPPRVKRQAARFRIYGYNAAGALVRELTDADADITWTVHLANKKAEWDKFEGDAGAELPIGQRRPASEWRNADIEGEAARQALIIDPGPRTLAGPGQSAVFDAGKFFDIPVPLGEIRSDEAGRLLVLGGFGKSAVSEEGYGLDDFANNDRWHDDVSDGPVTAQVWLKDGAEIAEVRPAWVIVGPPDFAPAVPNILTLYDIAFEVAVELGHPGVPERPSFTQHIAPILQRTILIGWVQSATYAAHGGHGNGSGNFTAMWDKLAANTPAAAPLRQAIFSQLRNPDPAAASCGARCGRRCCTARHTRPRLHGAEWVREPRLLAAQSSYLTRACGADWLAVGDAAATFDPLSSQGLLQALASAQEAAQAITVYLSGAVPGWAGYQGYLSNEWRHYLAERGAYYAQERRWPQQEFWSRRRVR